MGVKRPSLLRKPLVLGRNMITSGATQERQLPQETSPPPATCPILLLSSSISFLPSNGRRVTNLITCSLKKNMFLNNKGLGGFFFFIIFFFWGDQYQQLEHRKEKKKSFLCLRDTMPPEFLELSPLPYLGAKIEVCAKARWLAFCRYLSTNLW